MPRTRSWCSCPTPRARAPSWWGAGSGIRIRGHVADLGDDERIRVTASIGVAAFEGQGTVSFGSLIKDATAALRRAQLDGGDRVEAAAPAPKSRVSIG